MTATAAEEISRAAEDILAAAPTVGLIGADQDRYDDDYNGRRYHSDMNEDRDGQRRSGRYGDNHYNDLRERHMRQFDRDYDEYRQARQERMGEDFDEWRRNRDAERGSDDDTSGQSAGRGGSSGSSTKSGSSSASSKS